MTSYEAVSYRTQGWVYKNKLSPMETLQSELVFFCVWVVILGSTRRKLVNQSLGCHVLRAKTLLYFTIARVN